MTDTYDRTTDLRQQPGACPHLRETFHNPLTCMYCVPTNVRHCCRKHETEDLKGSIFGRHFIVCPTCQDKRCAHAEDCANACAGQQPAQPESGEARHPAIENLRNCQRQLDMDGCEVGVSRQAVDETLAEIDRLHLALTTAQQELAAANARVADQGKLLERARELLRHAEFHTGDIVLNVRLGKQWTEFMRDARDMAQEPGNG